MPNGVTHNHFVVITAFSASGVAAILYKTMVGQTPANDPVISLPATALATLLVAGLCWWALMRRPTLLRGAITGLLISILTLPLAVLLTILSSLTRNGPTEAGILQDLLLAPAFALGFSLLALAVVGFVTVPAGILGGVVLAFLQAKLVRER